MTVKEINLLKRKMWEVLMKNPEIADRVHSEGRATVVDLRDFSSHAIMIVNRDSQINDNTIRDHGIDPNHAQVKKLFTVMANHDISF